MRERLQKILAQNGRGSRRDCEDLIREGRVSVDGKMVEELGLHVDPEKQQIKVDGERLRLVAPCYFLLHKPPGVVCTMAEDERSPRAVDFAPKGAGRVHTIGRLDRDSEGLIILTNDGDLTERLTHPRHDMPKTYLVTIGGGISGEALAKMKKGVWLSEGKAKASSVKVLRHAPYATLLEIELREGKNREIRRILARVGYKVKTLKRVAIGPIKIAGLAPGKTRPLTPAEVAILYEAVGDEKRHALSVGSTRGRSGVEGAGLAARRDAALARGEEAAPRPLRPKAAEGASKTGAARGAPGVKAGKASAKPGKAREAGKAPAGREGAARAAKGTGTASPATPAAPPPPPARPLRDSLPAFEPIRLVGKGGAAPRPAAPAASGKARPAGGKDAQGERRPSAAAPAGPAQTRSPRLAAPPPEPPAARRTYTPDEDGVIVVRRPAPSARAFDESEEE